jgi:hypothetical protein
MRVIGGKEIPDTGGELGAYVTRIYPGGVVESLGEIKEGSNYKLIKLFKGNVAKTKASTDLCKATS